MNVRIVCYEDVDKWILGKFAKKLEFHLGKMGINCSIGKTADLSADINHHIIYYDYNGKKTTIDTVMITHIDNLHKHSQIQKQLTEAELGICMSKETMQTLSASGIPADRLAYVLPAHDQSVTVKKINIGITCRVQEDGRKRESLITKLLDNIPSELFKFTIMGDGWDFQVQKMKALGIEVDYYPQFHYETYISLFSAFDYYLYLGMDEGQMGFIDALAAGIKTIVTPQGYHLDATGGITHPFVTYDELEAVFNEISEEKYKLINSVRYWNWEDYTLKHVEIWQYLLDRKKRNTATAKSKYIDGLNSILTHHVDIDKSMFSYKIKLFLNYFYHQYFSAKKIGGLQGLKYLVKRSLRFIHTIVFKK